MRNLPFTKIFWRQCCVGVILFTTSFILQAAPKGLSPIVSTGKDGRLIYDSDAQSNRVPDFSHCGYAGADRVIPDAPVRVVVSPIAGESTTRIQQAIDYVAGLPMDSNGVRGAVLLLAGRHEISGGLLLDASGVVLRGQGAGENGTLLAATGHDRRTLIRIVGKNDLITRSNAGWEIKDDCVPVSALSFHVSDASGLKAGDPVRVVRPSTQAWIDKLGMTEFGGGIGDWRLTWKPGSRDLIWDRVIQSVEGNLVTVDAPITTALEKEFGGGHVEIYSWPGRLTNVGVENLRCESMCSSDNPKDEEHAWMAVTMENTADAWVRQVTAQHFAGSLVAIYENCKGVTVEDCLSLAPVSEDGGYRRHTFFTMGQETLFLRCWAEHGWHDFSVGHCAAGPNAFVQCEASEALGDSGAVESWASGVLFDNVRIDGNGLSLANRGSEGQGAGWAAANSVLWQCSAALIRCANPPGARNWSFGAWGEFDGDGVWRNSNAFVKPASLYFAQLADRTGHAAKSQLMARSMSDSDPRPDQMAEALAASHQPAPQLADYIAAAATRNPISTAAGDAKRVEEIGAAVTLRSDVKNVGMRKPILITNGWLTCEGKLLIGETLELKWWQGNIRPGEAQKYGERLTRFVPGRSGEGYTDDLNELAETMQAAGEVAVDHHYGLWYDRRREDHERIRRMNGDVWPPFYEQPFARSGEGAAWDGLSQYDLTKFNPWYWGRLRDFADICDRDGLVLFHENYFQHNLVEAGAHWADCPWRSANNINHTGFPEPVPFAGDKRLYMADQFYDPTNPARRALHRGYIRQCLENFANNSNVIQFTSGEYSGPAEFVRFWLDTIGEWDRETGHKPLVALSCPKDVQDTILADAGRSPLVDVICFRYWWETDKGLYAPKGGQNLAPRQSLRAWRGGMPTDLNLAKMAAEYRGRAPGKAVIAASEDNDLSRSGWAFLCAGGSLPNLPRGTDVKLLAAVPQMQPWAAGGGAQRWVLQESGRQYLIYLGAQAAREMDLTGETGKFAVSSVDPQTGAVTALAETLEAGAMVNLPATAKVVWLTREK